MAVTVTRNQHQLIIQSYTRRPDGRVSFTFILTRAGVWIEIPQSCWAYPPGDPVGFPMTPAWGDPQHVPSPIVVQVAGVQFGWVWDTWVDGYTSGNLAGWTFKLGYIDIYCCDEIEDDRNYPPDEPPPDTPHTPVDPPVEDQPPTNDIPPDDGPPIDEGPPVIDEGPPINDGDPIGPGGSIPPGTRWPEDPNAGHEDPDIQDPLFPGGNVEPGTFRLPDGQVFRFDGEQFWLQDPDRGWYPVPKDLLATIPGFVEGDFVEFWMPPEDHIDRTEDPGIIVDGPRGDFIQPSTEEPIGVPISTKIANTMGLLEPTQITEYPEDPDGHALFGLPMEHDGIEMRAYAPIEMNMNEFGLDRYTVTGLIRNNHEQSWGGGEVYVKAVAIGVDGIIRTISDPAQLEVCLPDGNWAYPDGSIIPVPPPPTPGTLPPGTSGLPAICFTVNGQLDPHVIQVLIVIMNGMFQPIMMAPAHITPIVVGPGLPIGTQFGTNQQTNTYPDLLGQEIREFCKFQTGIEPEYEGSYAGVGDEDTHVVVVERNRAAFVVTTTADALGSGFDPELLIYDVNDMTTPVVTVTSKLKKNGNTISPTRHVLGYRDDAGVLQVGYKYALVVKHKHPFYSKRWVYGIWHEENSVDTGGQFGISTSAVGNILYGIFSCAYGRQSIKLLNERTGDFIYVKTNEIGVSWAVTQNVKGGSPDKWLRVQYGDKIEIIRPGPALLYRRSGDLIGEAFVQ